MTSSFEGFGVSVSRPACIDGIESDGAIHGDTTATLEHVALWLKQVINSDFRDKGGSATPFESWLNGDVALPANGDTGNLEGLIRWATEKCHQPISRAEAEGIIWNVAKDGDRSEFKCEDALKCPSIEEYCTRERCYRFPRTTTTSDEGFSLVDFCIETEDGKHKFSRAKAAGSIRSKMSLAMDSTGKELYFFDGEIYQPTGALKVADTLYSVAGDYAGRQNVGEVLDRVKVRCQLGPVIFNSDPFVMPLQNGVLDLRSGEIRAYRAEDYLTFKYNARWDPEGGDWRRFIWFLCTSLPDPRDVLTAIDIMTAVALRIPFDIIVQLFGGGSNGKGVFEKVLLALFTTERSTALSLDELKRSRFGAGALFDVDLWIISEVEGVKDAISALKKVATGEFSDSDTKYGGRKKGRPHAVPILDSNHAFDYGDDSYGRKRRTARLDFCYTFGDEPGMRPIDRNLEDELKTPEDLAGIVQIIAARAPGLLRDRKIYRRKSTEEAEEEYRRQQYSLSYFCDECLGSTPPPGGDKLTVPAAHAAYEEYCRWFKVPTPAKKVALGKYISKVFGVTSSNTKIDGEDVRVYGGVYLTKSPARAYADHVNQFYSDTSDRTATDKRQKDRYEITISNYIATEATETLLSEVLKEICRIYYFLESCGGNERSISYENYRKNPVASVASVAEDRSITFFTATEERQNENHLSPESEISVAGGGGEDSDPSEAEYIPIAEELETAARRETDYLEHVKTPAPKAGPSEEESRPPSTEEAEILGEEAGRLLQDWPGVPEMKLWERVRDRLGKPIPLGAVRSWLKVEGYVETGQRLNGASLWNPPTSEGARA